jgi:hypothetical protein
MSREAAVRAYRDSIYDAAEIRANMRIGTRSVPLVGGIVPAFEALANGLWRPFKVMGALAFGYNGDDRKFPEMPPIPEAFKNTDLGKDFEVSWKFQEESAKARIDSFSKLLKLDVSGWWQESAIAQHASAKDRAVAFPEEQQAMNAARSGGSGGFVGALLSESISSSSKQR